jgi:hypothetical protein
MGILKTVKCSVHSASRNDKRSEGNGSQRHATSGRRGFYARYGANAFEARAREFRKRGGLLILIAGERYLHRQDVVGIEAQIHGAHGKESTDQESRADQKHKRQRHLARD